MQYNQIKIYSNSLVFHAFGTTGRNNRTSDFNTTMLHCAVDDSSLPPGEDRPSCLSSSSSLDYPRNRMSTTLHCQGAVSEFSCRRAVHARAALMMVWAFLRIPNILWQKTKYIYEVYVCAHAMISPTRPSARRERPRRRAPAAARTTSSDEFYRASAADGDTPDEVRADLSHAVSVHM